MTTLPRIQIRDPNHPARTALRVGFWLMLLLLLLGVGALVNDRSEPTTKHKTTPQTGPTKDPTAPVPAMSGSTPTTPAPTKPRGTKPRPPATKPDRRPTPSTRTPKRTPTPSRPTSRPHPPKHTSSSGSTRPSEQVPPPPTGTQNGQGTSPTTGNPTTSTPAPHPPAPTIAKPPSVHNCDPTNETC